MRLRNKKTGEVVELDLNVRISGYPNSIEFMKVSSLAELNKEWEDYKPAEPLIKDEKIRKAVRAWAEVNAMNTVLYDKDEDCIYSPYGSDKTDTCVSISFDETDVFEKLEHRVLYTIAELCGEEEE